MKRFDVTFTNRGSVRSMSRGFFEKTGKLSLKPWNDSDYVDIGAYRIDKTSCSTPCQMETMRKFFRKLGLESEFDAAVKEE